VQSKQLSYDRFNLVMQLSIVLGSLTNLYIIILLIYLDASSVIISPIVSTLIFISSFLLLKFNKINSKICCLIIAYTIAIEIVIHSCFLGWNSGFYYFMFLLPTVFILNATWKTWMLIFFNCTIILLTTALKIYLSNYSEIHPLDDTSLEYISLINLTGTGAVLILIMVYFSRTISFKDKAIIKVNAELEIQNKEIFEQYKHLQLLMKEIHHRVKNNLQIISSLMSLQERSVKDKDVIAVLNESKRRVEAIALIHQKLYQNENEYQVDFKSYLEEIMNNQQLINKKVRCKVKSEEIMLDLDTAVPLGLIISEMITNALKHAYNNIEKPTLTTTLSRIEDDYQIIIRDNGVGLPKDFNMYQTTSLGFEIITALADQIDANIEFSNSPGAQFSIKFKNKTSLIA
jgi:two-component sensor histidine kinase